MIRVTINNSSTPGTFFDNINNDNLFVDEYYLDDIEQFDEIITCIPKNSKVYIEDNVILKPEVNSELYSSLRYNYINEKTIDGLRTKSLDNLFSNFNDRFKLTKAQFKNYLDFCEEHKSCKIDDNGNHKFGAIGGGTSFNYALNYCAEEMFPNFSFIGIKCHACNTIDKLSSETKELTTEEKKKYTSHKNYGPGLNKIEFYRFMAIYDEFKSPLELSIMGTGLGYLISVKVKNFVFDITDNSNW